MPQAEAKAKAEVPPPSDLDWQEILDLLRTQMRRQTFETWLSQSWVELQGDRLTLFVENVYAREWLSQRLDSVIQRAVKSVTGRELEIDYQVGQRPAPAGQPPPAKTRREPLPGEISVELVSLDPTQWGIIPTARYAVIFWQPLLGQLSFSTWLTLRAFAWNQAEAWPSIETLASICAGGNRHRLLGRAARKGRGPQVGALEILQKAKVIHMRTEGRRKKRYYFKVLENLPLLTPRQVDYLPEALQLAHKLWLDKCSLDYEEWQQLDFSSFVGFE